MRLTNRGSYCLSWTPLRSNKTSRVLPPTPAFSLTGPGGCRRPDWYGPKHGLVWAQTAAGDTPVGGGRRQRPLRGGSREDPGSKGLRKWGGHRMRHFSRTQRTGSNLTEPDALRLHKERTQLAKPTFNKAPFRSLRDSSSGPASDRFLGFLVLMFLVIYLYASLEAPRTPPSQVQTTSLHRSV